MATSDKPPKRGGKPVSPDERWDSEVNPVGTVVKKPTKTPKPNTSPPKAK